GTHPSDRGARGPTGERAESGPSKCPAAHEEKTDQGENLGPGRGETATTTAQRGRPLAGSCTPSTGGTARRRGIGRVRGRLPAITPSRRRLSRSLASPSRRGRGSKGAVGLVVRPWRALGRTNANAPGLEVEPAGGVVVSAGQGTGQSWLTSSKSTSA